MKSKPGGSLFRMLVSSYILFALMMLVSFVIGLIITVIVMTGSLIPEIDPYVLAVDPDSSASRMIMNLGAWAEKLDRDYNVLEIRGDKADDSMSYSQSEIYDLLYAGNFGHEATGYRAFISEIPEENSYWIIKVPRDTISMQNTIKLTNNNSNSREFYLSTGIFLLLFFVNCVFLSLYLRRRIRKPLMIISEGMKKIENGEPDVYLDFKAQMEFEQIKESFNIMSERLRFEKRARVESERKKNQLLLDLSHDIKTPITTIKAYAHALDEGMVDFAEVSRYLKTIDEKASRVGALTDDLFTILSMDNPDYPVNMQNIDAAELVREVCAAHYDEMQRKGFEIILQIPDNRLLILADEKLLRRVLENLIGNAMKYNKSGSRIRISLRSENATVHFEVADDGEMILDEDRIFDAFTRGDAVRPSTEGSGLGLVIASSIVEKHNGKIGYTREDDENQFWFTLKG